MNGTQESKSSPEVRVSGSSSEPVVLVIEDIYQTIDFEIVREEIDHAESRI